MPTFHFPFLNEQIAKFNEYLNGPDGWNPVSNQPFGIRARFNNDNDALTAYVKGQTLENWHEDMCTWVSTELIKIIASAVKKGFERKGVSMHIQAIKDRMSFEFKYPNKPEYEFTALTIAESNPLKISGIRKVRLTEYLAARMETDLVVGRGASNGYSTRSWFDSCLRHEGLHRALAIFSDIYVCNLNPAFREEKGTYIKPAKIVTLFFGNDFTSNEISTIAGDIAGALRLRHNKNNTSEVMVSADVAEIYKTRTHEDLESCMAHDYIPRHRFQIYNDIPCCKIAYMKDDDGYIIARALLWDDVTDEDTKTKYKIMDRIYFTNAEVLSIMQCWAIKNGYLYKEEQALWVLDFITPSGECLNLKNLSIPFNVKAGMYKEVPYIDTFAYCDKGFSKCLYSSMNGYIPSSEVTEEAIERDGFILMQDTGGRIRWICQSEYKCIECGDPIPLGDVIHDGGHQYCRTCYDDLFQECEHCGAMEYRPDIVEVTVGPDEDSEVRCICQDCADRAYDDPSYLSRNLRF